MENIFPCFRCWQWENRERIRGFDVKDGSEIVMELDQPGWYCMRMENIVGMCSIFALLYEKIRCGFYTDAEK